jgi:hypothetical protein
MGPIAEGSFATRSIETPKGSLQIRAHKGRAFYEARWRDLDRIDPRKRLGPAWAEQDGAGH